MSLKDKHHKPKGWLAPFTEELGQSISEETLVTGVLRCSGDMHFNGRLKGALIHGFEGVELTQSDSPPTLWIGPKARVVGTIIARSVVLHGYVEGNIFTNELLHITNLGYVLGHVHCRSLRLDFGGVINGTSKMNVTNILEMIQAEIKEISATYDAHYMRIPQPALTGDP